MLSSFLPPVPSLPSDPPEHFPLRKTGELDKQVGPFRQRKGGKGLGHRGGVCRGGRAGLGQARGSSVG